MTKMCVSCLDDEQIQIDQCSKTKISLLTQKIDVLLCIDKKNPLFMYKIQKKKKIPKWSKICAFLCLSLSSHV